MLDIMEVKAPRSLRNSLAQCPHSFEAKETGSERRGICPGCPVGKGTVGPKFWLGSLTPSSHLSFQITWSSPTRGWAESRDPDDLSLGARVGGRDPEKFPALCSNALGPRGPAL